MRADRPSDAEVAEAHRVLSTPPDGRFTRLLVVQRRDDTGADVLRGIRHQRIGDGAFTRDLAERIAALHHSAAMAAVNAQRRAQAEPDVAFTHSAFEGWVKHHATGQKWPLRVWEQGRFMMPRG